MDGDGVPGRLGTCDAHGLGSTCPITVGQGTIVRSHMWRANREVIRTRAEPERSRKDHDGRTYRLSRFRISTVYWIDPFAIPSHDSSEGFPRASSSMSSSAHGTLPWWGPGGLERSLPGGLICASPTCR